MKSLFKALGVAALAIGSFALSSPAVAAVEPAPVTVVEQAAPAAAPSTPAPALAPAPTPAADPAPAATTYASDLARGLCNYTGSHPRIQPGAVGAPVVHLQCLLRNYWGYTNLAVDGSWGPATSDAVRSFQRAQGLDIDVIVGQLTWDKLHP